MKKNHFDKSFSVQTIIIFGFCIVVYMLFLITKEIYKDHVFVERPFLRIKNENELIRAENERKKKDLLYVSSPQYKDKYAKQNFNKVQPGEKVIVFAEVVENIFLRKDEGIDKRRKIIHLPNQEQWYEYFFGDQRYIFDE